MPTGKSFEFTAHTLELLSFSFYPLEKYKFAVKKFNVITEKCLLSGQISTMLLYYEFVFACERSGPGLLNCVVPL